MASYQRVALFILFDSLELDIIRKINFYTNKEPELLPDELSKAQSRIKILESVYYDVDSPTDLLYGLDLAEKFVVLLRHKDIIPKLELDYYLELRPTFNSMVSIRNSVMHARPLQVDQYSKGFAFAQDLARRPKLWPELNKSYLEFASDPAAFGNRSIQFLDSENDHEVIHNLPSAEYDDTGFLPRPDLEKSLVQKIDGRYPVVTILGEGGNGKTALTHQTLSSLINSGRHSFDAIIWTTAKASILTSQGVKTISNAITEAYKIVEEAAGLEPGNEPPITRLRRMLSENKILLVIDNLETIKGNELKELSEDFPGESKLLLTSRIPLGGDISVHVGEFTEKEALLFIRRLIQAYDVKPLLSKNNNYLVQYMRRLHFKPLLIKWFVLGVKGGSSPDKIVANPDDALRFCLENVVTQLNPDAKSVLICISSVTAKLSQHIIEEVTPIGSLAAEAACAELIRFGLIQSENLDTGEQVYSIKPFARAYVSRVISPATKIMGEMRTRYLKIRSDYERFLAGHYYNKYNPANYVVRSPSEMLAAKQLKAAYRFGSSNDYVKAVHIISNLKISDPTYFEVYRVEGFLAFLQGDVATSRQAYEAAIDLAPDEPQLHFFFGGMLMRGVDNTLADFHFRKTLEIDPDCHLALREGARNCFINGNIEDADQFLSQIKPEKFRTQKDIFIFNDLKIQYFTRSIFQFVSATDWSSAEVRVKEFANYLYTVDFNQLDQRAIDHMNQVLPNLRKIIDSDSGAKPWTEDLQAWLIAKFPEHAVINSSSTNTARLSGRLKREGLQSTFGFIKTESGDDHFLHKKDAGSVLWRHLLEGGSITFELQWSDGFTKSRAVNCLAE